MRVALLCWGVVELPPIITARLGDLLFCATLGPVMQIIGLLRPHS